MGASNVRGLRGGVELLFTNVMMAPSDLDPLRLTEQGHFHLKQVALTSSNTTSSWHIFSVFALDQATAEGNGYASVVVTGTHIWFLKVHFAVKYFKNKCAPSPGIYTIYETLSYLSEAL